MNRRVLIVDDDRDIRYLLRVMLTRAGYEVLEASAGEQALTLAAAQTPALCVLDVMMPEMSGLEVCRRLKQAEQTRAMPIIVLTAYGSDDNRAEALAAGVTDFISKPFSSTRLIERVRQLLE